MKSKPEPFDDPEVPETVSNPQSPKIWRRDDAGGGLTLLAEVTTLAWNLVIPIVGGVMLGHFIDNRMDSGVMWTLSLLTLGVMVALTNLYNLYIEHGRRKEKTSDKENHGKKDKG